MCSCANTALMRNAGQSATPWVACSCAGRMAFFTIDKLLPCKWQRGVVNRMQAYSQTDTQCSKVRGTELEGRGLFCPKAAILFRSFCETTTPSD